ncbi:dnaJ homolog subfamily C member 22-like [Uloborus diversus]|uniref:dnaJ homolog subfamily C member 22-like n=1 Tax=Uloborus diversus TaxID=327109 RepID=UPI00240A16E0|nr:dnaJ homolog subfamily C member 22-like [Uloborus diversus]
MAKKSLFITYFLWLVGGLFGLHHFYLGRDFHAFVWWMTVGGYFGAGWVRDLWRIPEYVQDANDDPAYMEKLAETMRKLPKPPTNSVRYFGQLMVADALGYLFLGALPRDFIEPVYLKTLNACLVPLAVALGIYLVGNIGRHEGRLKASVLGAYLTMPLYWWLESPVFLTSFASASLFNSYSKQWRRTPRQQKSLWRRITFLVLAGLLYSSLWASWLYFNCEITYGKEEVPVKCREAAKHFFKSPLWQEFVKVMKEMWRVFISHGWREVWRELVEALDPTGEANAYKVLGLSESATQEQIKSRYRKLSREWHPDKWKDANSKQVAQEKFIDIQQAYELLSSIKSKRIQQNVRIPEEEMRTSDINPEDKWGKLILVILSALIGVPIVTFQLFFEIVAHLKLGICYKLYLVYIFVLSHCDFYFFIGNKNSHAS